MISPDDKTKECGLEVDNCGDIHTERPLVMEDFVSRMVGDRDIFGSRPLYDRLLEICRNNA